MGKTCTRITSQATQYAYNIEERLMQNNVVLASSSFSYMCVVYGKA